MSLRLLLVNSSGSLFRSARLVGSLPTRPRAVRGAVAITAIGAFSLIDPHRLTPWQRATHRFVSGALAVMVGADLAREDPIVDPVTDAVLLGGAALALAGPAEELDGVAVRGLEQLGCRHPRTLLALGGAAVTAATYALAAHRPEDAEAWGEMSEAFDPDVEHELEDRTRSLIDGLIGQETQAETLRTQLATARRRASWGPESIELSTDETLPRVLPRTQVWPAHGSFAALGHRYRLDLLIVDGRLSSLAVVAEGDDHAVDRALEAWSLSPRLPWIDDVEIWHEADRD